jgi:hypothetical protein
MAVYWQPVVFSFFIFLLFILATIYIRERKKNIGQDEIENKERKLESRSMINLYWPFPTKQKEERLINGQ